MFKKNLKLILILSIAIILPLIWKLVHSANRSRANLKLNINGIIEAREVNLSSKISGKIDKFCCIEGQNIDPGDPAILLEDQEKEIELKLAKNHLESVMTFYPNKKNGQILSDTNIINQAKAGYDLARIRFEDTRIKSPIKGTITKRYFEKGEFVNPGIPIMTIVALDKLYARVEVDETKIARIILNNPAQISAAWIPGQIFPGKIIEINQEGEFATERNISRGRQDIKTYRVKVALPEPTPLLKPGMTVNVFFP